MQPQMNNPQPQFNRFLEGVLYGCNDAGSIPDALASGYAVIAVVDIEEAYKYANVPNLAIMSNLLPPPEAVTAYIDGEAAIGHQIYYEYLSNREREATVVTVLQALYGHRPSIRFRNFLIYTDYEPDVEFNILYTLGEFFKNTFGIVMAPYKQYQAYNIGMPQYDYIISNLLFSNGKINKYEFVSMLPQDAMPTDVSCSILLSDINYQPSGLEDGYRIVCNYIAQLRAEIASNYTMKSPIIQINDKLNKDLEQSINDKIFESQSKFGNQ
jgi:hypothetical protein